MPPSMPFVHRHHQTRHDMGIRLSELLLILGRKNLPMTMVPTVLEELRQISTRNLPVIARMTLRETLATLKILSHGGQELIEQAEAAGLKSVNLKLRYERNRKGERRNDLELCRIHCFMILRERDDGTLVIAVSDTESGYLDTIRGLQDSATEIEFVLADRGALLDKIDWLEQNQRVPLTERRR